LEEQNQGETTVVIGSPIRELNQLDVDWGDETGDDYEFLQWEDMLLCTQRSQAGDQAGKLWALMKTDHCLGDGWQNQTHSKGERQLGYCSLLPTFQCGERQNSANVSWSKKVTLGLSFYWDMGIHEEATQPDHAPKSLEASTAFLRAVPPKRPAWL
jgi:hypothetical protein